VNRALPPGNCGDRGADPGRASGRTRPVPGTVGLVGRSENPPKRATLPSQYPAARDLGLDAVGALSAFRLGGLDRQAHFLSLEKVQDLFGAEIRSFLGRKEKARWNR
jgi:hypothetical protein